ncbi:hypothetical protein ACFJGV_15185 [Cnuibacter sp. UC19_7]|uniref:hypothetical protein n=1 Tax=Cnuibacter sp. UC19_7 TaxID=3350166 RepID=UPI00366E67EC
MVDTIWPADAVNGAPLYSGRKLRQTQSPLQVMGTSARPLGARTGVRPGTPTNTVTVTSTTWTCKPIAGTADVVAAAEAGPYTFAFDANATGALAAADGSHDRIDIIYIQIDDPAEGDSTSAPAATRKYFAGTPGSSAAPAPPVARSFVIAQIAVPRSGGGSPSVTWVAPYTGAGVVPVRSTTELDAWAAPDGTVAVQLDTGAVVPRVGGAWRKRTTDNGWSVDHLMSGKRMYRRQFAPWSSPNPFGAAGGSFWVQDRTTGLTPPAGRAWDDFSIRVDVWPTDITNNAEQQVLRGNLTKATGTDPANLRIFNPSGISVATTYQSVACSVTLTEL